MRCITVHQPYASAIFELGKDVENRSWKTDYRGPLAIHASKRFDESAVLPAKQDLYRTDWPLGSVIGIVQLVDCVRDSHSKWAMRGQWHWVLSSPVMFSRPVALIGRQRLYYAKLELSGTSAAAFGLS